MYYVSVARESGARKYGDVYGSEDTYEFEAEVLKHSSIHAINKRFIVELIVWRNDRDWEYVQQEIIAYERGWVLRPQSLEDKGVFNAIVEYFKAEKQDKKQRQAKLNKEYRRCKRAWKWQKFCGVWVKRLERFFEWLAN